MYRIIGITSSGEMKLIKNTSIQENSGSIKSYQWEDKMDKASCENKNCTWPNSDIFKRLNGKEINDTKYTDLFVDSTTSNVNYLSKGNSWYNKINEHNWIYGDIGVNANGKTGALGPSTPASTLLLIETGKAPAYYYNGSAWSTYYWNSQTDIVPSKIGLMYLHDYYYSYQGSDSTNCFSSSAGCKNSWLHINNNGKATNAEEKSERVMTWSGLYSNGNSLALWINSTGNIGNSDGLVGYKAVRPVFYLSSSVKLVGSGTVSDPYIVQA